MRRKKHIEELEQIKEIKEMADIIHEGDCPIIVLFYNDSLTLAENLYNAGYRKASDVALEAVDSFQRILRHIFLNMCDSNDYERLNLLQIDGAIEALYDSFIAELKKKYESEGEG